MEELFQSLSESVSEQCYDEIMGLVEEIVGEGLTKALIPVLAGKDKYGREESFGTKVDRASLKHPLILKAARKIDGLFSKKTPSNNNGSTDTRTPEQKLKNVKPAGTIYGRDMYSPGQLKDAGYKLK